MTDRTTKTDVVSGYAVQLEPMAEEGRGEWFDCWVTSPDGLHTNSLQCLQGEGRFDDGPAISERALDLIEAWAIRHGYDD